MNTKYYNSRFFRTRFVPLIGGTRKTRRSRNSEIHETRENEKPRSKTIHTYLCDGTIGVHGVLWLFSKTPCFSLGLLKDHD